MSRFTTNSAAQENIPHSHPIGSPTSQFATAGQMRKVRFVPAGFLLRTLAFCIDYTILNLITAPLYLASHWVFEANIYQSIVWIFLPFIIYYIYCGYFYTKKGATPGKEALGLYVVRVADGRKPSWGDTAKRELIGKILSVLSFGIGLLMMLMRRDKKALHDLIAGTIVLHRTIE